MNAPCQLHEDGEGERGQRFDTVTVALKSEVWQRLEALASAEQLPASFIAWAVLASLLDRLAGGPVRLWLWHEPDMGAAAALADTRIPHPSCLRAPAPADDLITAVRKAMQAYLNERCDDDIKVPASATRPYVFLYRGTDVLLREAIERTSADEQSRPATRASIAPQCDLMVELQSSANACAKLELTVDSAAFSSARGLSLLTAYGRLLEAATAEPRLALAKLPLADVHDRALNLARTGPRAPCALADEPSDLSSLFAAAVRRWPGLPAIVSRSDSTTFAEVASAVSGLADTLRTHHAGPGDTIAFRIGSDAPPESGVLYLLAQLAAFEAGCAIMPLGQQITAAQALSQIELTGARFLICTAQEPDCAPAWISAAGREGIAGFPSALLFAQEGRGMTAAALHQDRVAVILTSSGTTGKPKTVRLSHAMLLGTLHALADANLFPAVPTLVGPNIGFDVVIADVWLPWIFGRPVVVLDTERRTPTTLAAAVALGARMVSLTATQAMANLDEDPTCYRGFEALHVGGEALPLTAARRLEAAMPGGTVVNGYGPSENAILSTAWPIATDGESRVPIGCAMPGYRVLIADEAQRPLPAHWPGELLIASAAPALGYFGRAMTRARFIEIPGEAPGPFFRTGDYGWIDSKGRVQFIGRRDRQTKIMGVRVELNGIEYRIAEVDGVADVGVVQIERLGRPQIVAAVQPAGDIEAKDRLSARITEHCRIWLARVAVPSRIVFVDEMPKGASGKKSYRAIRALADQPTEIDASGTAPEPRSVEAMLAQMWAERLWPNASPSHAIRLEDDVFALGATSLDVMTMTERIERTLGVSVSHRQMLLRPTIAAQASLLRGAHHAPAAKPTSKVTQKLISFRQVRRALKSAPSRGTVLIMPAVHSGPAHAIVAARGLDEYDIWNCTASTGKRHLSDENVWPEVVEAIFEAITQGAVPNPTALFGFSLAGWIAWLIEQMLVEDGHDPCPVLCFDGGPLHIYFDSWQDKVAKLRRGAARNASTRMLLLHRPHRCWYDQNYELAEDWPSLGVDVRTVALRSVRHRDCVNPAVITKVKPYMSAFIAGDPMPADCSEYLEIPGPGAALARILDADEPPKSAELHDLFGRLPSGPVDREIRLALLFAAVCSGDADLALAVARRLNQEDPAFRPAIYAEVAVLAARGQHDLASARAALWMHDHPKDKKMETRATRRPVKTSWDIGPARVRSPMEGLDFAVGLI